MNLNHNEISTVIPNGWDDRTMITLIAPFAPGYFAANVVVNKYFVEPTDSIEDFAREQTRMLGESVPEFEVLDQRGGVVNTYPSYQQLHRFRTENGMIQQVQTFLLKGQAIYAITGTALVEDFDKHIQAFREIVENFQITAN